MPNRKPLTPPLQSDDVRLLTELGFVAAAAGLTAQSSVVFESLMRLRPWRAFPYIGMATGHLNDGHPDQAQSVLSLGLRVVEQHRPADGDADAMNEWAEDRALLAAFSGLALHLGGHRAQSNQVLERCLKIQPDGPGVRMARVMLGMPADGSALRTEPSSECYP